MKKERDVNAVFEAIFSRAKQLVAVHFYWKQECDRDEIVNAFCFKWWEKGTYLNYTSEGLYKLMEVSVRRAAIDLWRSEKKHLDTIMFSSFDKDDYDDKPTKEFVDDYAESPMDAYIERESVREFVTETINSRQLHTIVKRFGIKKSYFQGAEVSWQEIITYIQEALISCCTPKEVREVILILKSLPSMPVNKLYYKIYNETKSKKKKEEKLFA